MSALASARMKSIIVIVYVLNAFLLKSFKGWGTPPQQSGYAPQGYNPGGGQSYQWGAAQAASGQQMPQWGSYGQTQQSYGYGERASTMYNNSSSRYN